MRGPRLDALNDRAAPAADHAAGADRGEAEIGADARELRYRDHDLRIRRYHLAGLTPDEIAVVLNSQGLRVRTWAVGTAFVRDRLRAMALPPNRSRNFYNSVRNRYRDRPAPR